MGLPLFVALLGLLATTPAEACGGTFCQPFQPVLQAGENIAFGISESDNGNDLDVTMIVQINYEGPSEEFGWILPVPTIPRVSVGSDLLFEAIFEASKPTFRFTIDNARTDTCDTANIPQCEFSDGDGDVADSTPLARDEDGAIVLEIGVVGPFEFVILEAADNRPESILEWLGANGYDQPPEAAALINYYAAMEMKFVALRLQKQSETGDIRPLILNYSIQDADLEGIPVACIPIQLTGIAATPAMPIQIYVLSPFRAFPVNYFAVTLDDRLVDWVGCGSPFGGLFNGENCFLNDMRARFSAVANAAQVEGHAFLTEYAGSTNIVAKAIELNIVLDELYEQVTAKGFLLKLAEWNVPDIAFVHTIIERHIPNRFLDDGRMIPSVCFGLANVYTPNFPFAMESCLDFVNFGDTPFNSTALADQLNADAFEPAREAQAWVDSYAYLTRLYGQLDPEQMDKDPFFAFNSTLEDVSREHQATGVPVCESKANFWDGLGLDIYVWNQETEMEEEPFFVEASLGCGMWFRTNPSDPILVTSALELAAFGFGGQESRALFPDQMTGEFSSDDIQELIDLMDGRVPNQTIPLFSSIITESTNPATEPTNPPTNVPDQPPSGIGSGGRFPSVSAYAAILSALVVAALSS
jgi:hypothetical protein